MGKKVKFRDLKTGKNFETDDFKLRTTKNKRRLAVTIAPSGVKATVFVKKDFKK